MSRSKYVSVGDTGGLILDSKYDDFATDAKLEQLKSELELVKSELQTIKANQLSGDQKVQLSGTIVVETVGDLPSTGYMAQVALVSEGRRVFIYDGNEWGEW